MAFTYAMRIKYQEWRNNMDEKQNEIREEEITEEVVTTDADVQVEETPEEILDEFAKEFLSAILESEEEDCTYIGDVKVNMQAAEDLSSRKIVRAAKLAGVAAEGAVYAFIDVNPLVEYYDEVQPEEDEEDDEEVEIDE